MNMIQKAVTDALDSLHIDYEITEHPPVYTIDEMKNLGITHKGDVVKNLFLRDAKGKRHFLVVLDKDKRRGSESPSGTAELQQIELRL
mgnify:CR=1 FL=1